jgi:hypothetical protein
MAAGVGAVVARELDEVDRVRDRDRAREVGQEDEARFQQRDEQQVAAGVLAGDLRAELGDADLQLLGGEKDLAYTRVGDGVYDARSSR